MQFVATADPTDDEPSVQQAVVLGFVTRKDLLQRLSVETQARYGRVKKTLGYDPVGGSLRDVHLSVLAFGVYRALIERFSKDYGLSPDWWRDRRREFGVSARARQADHDIIARYYPEFQSYVPEEPLTDDEVIEAAKREFRLFIAASGTPYADEEAQLRATKSNRRVAYAPKISPRARHKTPIGLCYTARSRTNYGDCGIHRDGDVFEFFDPEAQARVEDVLVWERLYDERNVFGLSISRVAALAMRDFGTNGLFWLAEWLLFPGKYTDLLRVMGVTPEMVGVQKFEAIKRDMVRKLPRIHEHMMAVLREDPEMLRLREEVWGDTPTEPVTETRFGNPRVPDLGEERTRSFLRQREQLLVAVASDPQVAHLAPAVEKAIPETGLYDPLLTEFNRAKVNELRWMQFKRGLLRRFKQAA